MWLGTCDRGQTHCPCCHSRYAVTMPLREEWHLSHFNSWSCLRQSWGLIKKLLQAKLVFFSAYFFALPQPRVQTVMAPEANWAKGDSGFTGELNFAVGVGTGQGEQAHSDTHHAAGTLGSLFEPLVCGVCFFFLFPAVSSVWMVEHKGYFEGAHRWLWFGQSWQTACQLLLI